MLGFMCEHIHTIAAWIFSASRVLPLGCFEGAIRVRKFAGPCKDMAASGARNPIINTQTTIAP